MSDQQILTDLCKRLFDPETCCWRCGNAGHWFEQIDGPDNLRKVYCDNPIHFGTKTINLPGKP